MEREWKLGKDLDSSDNILDGITFDELILTLHCNLRKNLITPDAVKRTFKDIVEGRIEDMQYLLDNNMTEIIDAAVNYSKE